MPSTETATQVKSATAETPSAVAAKQRRGALIQTNKTLQLRGKRRCTIPTESKWNTSQDDKNSRRRSSFFYSRNEDSVLLVLAHEEMHSCSSRDHPAQQDLPNIVVDHALLNETHSPNDATKNLLHTESDKSARSSLSSVAASTIATTKTSPCIDSNASGICNVNCCDSKRRRGGADALQQGAVSGCCFLPFRH